MTAIPTSLEHAPASRTQWLITLYAGGGEFCDGYILSIIGVALPLLTTSFSLTSADAGLLGAASLIGMFFGGTIFGAVTDRFGRQKVYLADLALFIVLSALQFFATEPWQLIVLRSLMGVAIGADLAIAGTIASEFAPQKSRGPLLVVLVTMFSVGAAVAYAVGWAMLHLGPDAWRWMLASSAVPALVILAMRFGTPESPRWLLNRGRTAEAESVLRQMLGPDATIADIAEPEDSPRGYLTIFRGEYRRRTLFIALFWACQLLPIYAIATYEPTILESFGMAKGSTAYLGAVLIQIFYVAGSLSGALFINRGRRKLLLYSFAISALPLLGLALWAHPPIWLVLVLFGVFGIAMYSGQCLEAIYPSELFPTGVRATANGFATGASRIGAAIGVYGAPHLLGYSLQLAMLVGAGVAGLGWLFTLLMAPETAGKALTESSAVTPGSGARTAKPAVADGNQLGAAL
ncbi:MFS transporter [Nocardia sp. NEAU-G5]|uniref:MFS transporter n=1 Tax=Nocardia albiluteola TaxID=2842303 RepID=A0ABS6B2E1_9NOCA|nr:MFS transporter [Nocardia albiluteola]MBU3063945.1 MFS transporter [Nocardia albiluteola]